MVLKSKSKISKPRRKIKTKRRAVSRPVRDRVFYAIDPEFEFFGELKSLILKSSPAIKDRMTKRISSLGLVKMAVISGIFVNNNEDLNTFNSKTDLFIVGDDIDSRKLKSFLKSLEAEVGKEIRFGLMEKDEFEYRYGMFDRFVRVLLEAPHEKLINKLGL